MLDSAAGVLTGLAIVVASLGYGLGLRRLVGARDALPLAVTGGAGLTLFAALAGWPVAFGAFSRGVGLLLLAPGVVLLALSARELPRPRFAAAGAGALALLAAAALVFVPKALGAVHVVRVNACDDWVAYYHLPKLLLESGALDDPFAFRRLATLGVGPLLQSYFFPIWASAGVRVADAAIGGVLVWGVARALASLATPRPTAARVEALGLLGGVGALTIPVGNVSPVLLPFGSALLLLWLSDALVRGRGGARDGIALAIFWGGAAAFLTGVRTNNVVFPGLLGLAGVALALASRDAGALRRWGLAALAFGVALAPWSLASWRSSGTPFFPLIPGNFRFPSGLLAPLSAGETLEFVTTALWGSRLFLPLLLAALLVGARGFGRTAFVCAVAVLGSVVATALALTASDGFNVVRYSAPFVVAATVFLAALWSGIPAPGAASARRAPVVLAVALAATAWLFLPIPLEVKDAFGGSGLRFTSPARQVRKNATVAFDAAGKALTEGPQLEELRGERHFAAVQARLGPEARIFSAVAKPFLWRFDRHVVHSVDCPGQASPAPGMPFFQGEEALAAYLTRLGYTHLAFSPPSRGFCLYSLERWRLALRSGHFLWEQWAPYFIDFLENEQRLTRRGVVYQSPDVVVVDLRRWAAARREPASPESREPGAAPPGADARFAAPGAQS